MTRDCLSGPSLPKGIARTIVPIFFFLRHPQRDLTFNDEQENKPILIVHDTKPPFLDGRLVFTKQMEPVLPIKDSTSDMAVIARNGSKVRSVATRNRHAAGQWGPRAPGGLAQRRGCRASHLHQVE